MSAGLFTPGGPALPVVGLSGKQRRQPLTQLLSCCPGLALQVQTHRREPDRDGGWAEGRAGEVMGRKSLAGTALKLQSGLLTGTEDTGSSPPVP